MYLFRRPGGIKQSGNGGCLSGPSGCPGFARVGQGFNCYCKTYVILTIPLFPTERFLEGPEGVPGACSRPKRRPGTKQEGNEICFGPKRWPRANLGFLRSSFSLAPKLEILVGHFKAENTAREQSKWFTFHTALDHVASQTANNCVILVARCWKL